MTATLESRMDALEQLVREYALAASGSERLSAGVERLADETGGLNMLLHRVDEQQQQIAVINQEVVHIEQTKVSKDDLTKATLGAGKETQREHKKARKRTYIIAALIVLLTAGAMEGLLLRQNGIRAREAVDCREDARLANIVRAYVNTQTDIELTNRFIDDALREKRIAAYRELGLAFPTANCEEG